MPELPPSQDAFATTGPAFMVTVRQSITALYEEAQRSAVEGAPMLAVLQSDAVEQDSLPDRTDTDNTIPLPATAIAARFDELRRLADLEAGDRPSDRPAGPETSLDIKNDPFAAIDLSAGFGAAARGADDDDANDNHDDELGAPRTDNPPTIPVVDMPATGFGAASEDTGEPAHEEPSDAKPAAQATVSTEIEPAVKPGIETGTALPEEPPAPASNHTGDDLDIADIHTLVREAWEDETALGDIASPQAVEAEGVEAEDAEPEAAGRVAYGHAETPDMTAVGNIEAAMQEIAAAVVQSADSSQAIDVEAMKREIIAAMRSELQAVVDSDLKSVIKTAVAEAMSDMPTAEKTAQKTSQKTTPGTSAKQAAKVAAKAAAKTAPKKAAAKKKAAPKASTKTANGKATDDSES